MPLEKMTLEDCKLSRSPLPRRLRAANERPSARPFVRPCSDQRCLVAIEKAAHRDSPVSDKGF